MRDITGKRVHSPAGMRKAVKVRVASWGNRRDRRCLLMGFCHWKLNRSMPLRCEQQEERQQGPVIGRWLAPWNVCTVNHNYVPRRLYLATIKVVAFPRQFQIYSSETIIISLSSCQQLLRNFQKDYSATFRYRAAHLEKNALISSSGILIPHLSGSFLVIFP